MLNIIFFWFFLMSFWSSRKRLPLIDLLCAVAAYEKLILVRDEPLENLWAGGWGGRGGGAKYKEKIRTREN